MSLRGAGLLVLKGKANQESIQRLTATIKCIDRIATVELFNAKRSHLHSTLVGSALFDDARLIEQPRKAWNGAGRSVERSLKRFPPLSIQPEPLAIGQRRLCAGERAFKHEIANRPSCGLGGRFQRELGRSAEPKV
jgi:hypothetical protein